MRPGRSWACADKRLLCNRAFNPRGIIAYDNKLRQAAGLPLDDELEQRLVREGH